MNNSQESAFSREEIFANWHEHRESVSQMSEDELHQVARKAVALFRRVAEHDDQQPWEKLRTDIEDAKPEVEYLFLRMTAGDRLSSPIGWEESDKAYRQRARAIAVGVAARFTGYEVTREDWPIA